MRQIDQHHYHRTHIHTHSHTFTHTHARQHHFVVAEVENAAGVGMSRCVRQRNLNNEPISPSPRAIKRFAPATIFYIHRNTQQQDHDEHMYSATTRKDDEQHERCIHINNETGLVIHITHTCCSSCVSACSSNERTRVSIPIALRNCCWEINGCATTASR